MRILLTLLIVLAHLNPALSQNETIEKLLNYAGYTIDYLQDGQWFANYFLEDGLVIAKESYWGKELRRRLEYRYDDQANRISATETFNINQGKVNEVSQFELLYNQDSLLVERQLYGYTEKYADFNAFARPRLIERTGKLGSLPSKEEYEYDEEGNVSKSTYFYNYEDAYGRKKQEIEIQRFKYDSLNNPVEILREFKPKRKFPVQIFAGALLYPFEKYRYVYNRRGLWVWKFRTVNGVEKLIEKRKFEPKN